MWLQKLLYDDRVSSRVFSHDSLYLCSTIVVTNVRFIDRVPSPDPPPWSKSECGVSPKLIFTRRSELWGKWPDHIWQKT